MKAWEQIRPLFLALVGVVVVLSAFYTADPRFFFLNDRQVQYFPYGMIIRDALQHGEFPFITTRTFFGGALWLDPQYGLYNPLSLLLDFLINPQALEQSGFVMSLLLNLLLAGAVYTLGRVYDLGRDYAALLGLMLGINIFVLNFYSNMWQPALVSTIWSVFAWAALKNLVEAPKHIAPRVLLAALLIFLTVSGGWPHQYVAVAAVMAVLFFDALRAGNRRGALRLLYAGALGAVFGLPVLAPVLAAASYWSRNTGFYNNGVLSPDLGDLLNFSNPVWLPRYKDFYLPIASAPLFFAGWFILPLLAGMKGIRFVRQDARKWGDLMALFGIFTLLTLSAQETGPLRWPSRWLVDAHLALLLLLLLFVQRAAQNEKPFRQIFAMGALLVTSVVALLENPEGTFLHGGLVLLSALFICALPKLSRPMGLPLFLGATSVIIAAAIGICFAGDSAFLDHGKRSQSGATERAGDISNGYELFWGLKKNTGDLPDERLFLEGATGSYYYVNTINGYSSLNYTGLERVLPGVGRFPDFSSLEKLRIAEREAETGASYLDLLKILKITSVEKLAPSLQEFAGRNWIETKDQDQFLFGRRAGEGLAFGPDRLVTFERKAPVNLPGTISWHSPLVSVGGTAGSSQNGESLDIINRGGVGTVVFARLYYPGFAAVLNGKPLPVRALDHLLVAVDVPAGGRGQLILSFLPPLMKECLALVGLALFGWAVAAVIEYRRKSEGKTHE